MVRATMESLKARMGVRTAKDVFRRLARMRRWIIVDEIATTAPVVGVRDGERWVAVCECGGAEVVAGPDAPEEDQVYFCCSCGNQTVGGRWRPVMYEYEE